MISQEQLDGIVRRWAVSETFARGVPCEPQLDEFSNGWVVWAPYPPGRFPSSPPGSGKTVIIDRESGTVTVVPGLPPSVAVDTYIPPQPNELPVPPAPPGLSSTQQRRRAALLEAELTRYGGAAPVMFPQLAAELTVDGQTFTALGHTGDSEPAHHRLVLSALNAIPPGSRNRGADRQSELIALSLALTELLGQHEADLARVRQTMASATTRVLALSEQVAPDDGSPAYSCHTSRTVLLALGVPGHPPLDLVAPPVPERQGDDPITRGLVIEELTSAALRRGLRHERQPLPFLPDVLVPYGLHYFVMQSGPGQAQRVETFTIGAGLSAETTDTLGEFGACLGTRLFPVGYENTGQTSVIAVDEQQRVFALDHTGAWYLGPRFDEAVQTLLTGTATPRVRSDGSWG